MVQKKKTTKKKTAKKEAFKVTFEGSCDPKDWEKKFESKGKCHSSGGGCFYGLGFVGAAVYYISTATSFWGGVLGILKAIVWPAFLVYRQSLLQIELKA